MIAPRVMAEPGQLKNDPGQCDYVALVTEPRHSVAYHSRRERRLRNGCSGRGDADGDESAAAIGLLSSLVDQVIQLCDHNSVPAPSVCKVSFFLGALLAVVWGWPVYVSTETHFARLRQHQKL